MLPGPNGSSLAAVRTSRRRCSSARAKRDIGRSFIGVLVTDREAQIRRQPQPRRRPRFPVAAEGHRGVTGQWLYSDTRTPNRPDLADEWTGQSMTSHAASCSGATTRRSSIPPRIFKDVGDGFRAETGFVPQVGLPRSVRRRRLDLQADRLRLEAAHLRERRSSGGSGGRVDRPRRSARGRDEHALERLHAVPLHRRRHSRRRSRRSGGSSSATSRSSARRGACRLLSIDGTTGQEIDFANARPGTGTTMNVRRRSIRPITSTCC